MKRSRVIAKIQCLATSSGTVTNLLELLLIYTYYLSSSLLCYGKNFQVKVTYFAISMNTRVQCNCRTCFQIINWVLSGTTGFSSLMKLTEIKALTKLIWYVGVKTSECCKLTEVNRSTHFIQLEKWLEIVTRLKCYFRLFLILFTNVYRKAFNFVNTDKTCHKKVEASWRNLH